eukprot:PLAT11896.1.p2 GENE.PLAT11896.1~~PLAT11896.1.p2  ORF type:complete len:330 (+),score=136.59 PLAT11896.1:142-990(+)
MRDEVGERSKGWRPLDERPQLENHKRQLPGLPTPVMTEEERSMLLVSDADPDCTSLASKNGCDCSCQRQKRAQAAKAAVAAAAAAKRHAAQSKAASKEKAMEDRHAELMDRRVRAGRQATVDRTEKVLAAARAKAKRQAVKRELMREQAEVENAISKASEQAGSELTDQLQKMADAGLPIPSLKKPGRSWDKQTQRQAGMLTGVAKATREVQSRIDKYVDKAKKEQAMRRALLPENLRQQLDDAGPPAVMKESEEMMKRMMAEQGGIPNPLKNRPSKFDDGD